MTVVARAGVALALVVAGCGDSNQAATDATPPMTAPSTLATVPPMPITAPDVVAVDAPIITGEPSGTMPEALVPGRVVLDGGCIRLRIDGLALVVAVWPHGTRWEGGSIVLPDDRVVDVGDHVEGGGGYYSAAGLGQLMPAVLEPVLRCLPPGAGADTADQVVLTYPEIVVPASGPETAPSVPPPGAPDGREAFGEVLAGLGVDVAESPDAALGSVDQVICGAEVLDHDEVATGRYDEGARRCFLDAHLAGVPAAFASSQPTIEGDPIVSVWTTSAEDVGAWIDATRDAFGWGRWEELGPCGSFTTVTPATVPRPALEFACAPEPLAPRVAPPADAIPASFWERSLVPVCGYSIGVAQVDVGERECFRNAVANGQPAESIGRSVTPGGQVEALWFRSLANGEFEAFEMVADPGSGMVTWTRYRCDGFTFANGRPTLDETCQPA